MTQSNRVPYPLLHNTLLAVPFAMLIFGLAQGGPLARALSLWVRA